MHSTTEFERDPVIEEIAETISVGGSGRHRIPTSAAVVSGPPGFGKTSVLRAAARRAGEMLCAEVVWVPGGIVGSEQHLRRFLPGTGNTGDESDDLATACKQLGASTQRVVIAIDDFDVLTFKRESTPETIGRMIAQSANVRLLASCRPESSERLTARGHPFADAALRRGEIRVHTLGPLDDRLARSLIKRRAPALPSEYRNLVIAEAGGHPAALVFLSRLAVLLREVSASDMLSFAADFAGAVYGEAWSALGPQQRAIVWELSRARPSMTAAEIARAVDVRSEQVSSQLTRLVNEGLVLRRQMRGHFGVAPLLARWIARRASADGVKPGTVT